MKAISVIFSSLQVLGKNRFYKKKKLSKNYSMLRVSIYYALILEHPLKNRTKEKKHFFCQSSIWRRISFSPSKIAVPASRNFAVSKKLDVSTRRWKDTRSCNLQTAADRMPHNYNVSWGKLACNASVVVATLQRAHLTTKAAFQRKNWCNRDARFPLLRIKK